MRQSRMHCHVVQASERALQAFKRDVDLPATAVRPQALEEFPDISYLLYGDPQFMPSPRVHGPQLANSFGNLTHSPREFLLCELFDRLPPKGSLKGIRVVA